MTPNDPLAGAAAGTEVRPGRRSFLKLIGLTAGALATAPAAAKAAGGRLDSELGDLAARHAKDPALLIDISKCTGCAACTTACKSQNGLEWRPDQRALGEEARLASSNWTVVKTVHDKGTTRYAKAQCMHCLEPACASACFVKALRKTAQGPVAYESSRCVGCRYCLLACPFGVPTFEWDKRFPLVSKCSLCANRVAKGEATACATACPTGAVTFGTREKILAAAHKRIASNPKTYQKRVYGETEAGGTSVLYISDVPFSRIGLPEGIPNQPLPDFTWQVSRTVPPAALGIGAVLAAVHMVKNRAAESGTVAESKTGDAGADTLASPKRKRGHGPDPGGLG